jgi:hypothetical protein
VRRRKFAASTGRPLEFTMEFDTRKSEISVYVVCKARTTDCHSGKEDLTVDVLFQMMYEPHNITRVERKQKLNRIRITKL